MTIDSRWRRTEELFHRALELPPEARGSLLDRESSDAAMRQEIEALLRLDEDSADPLAGALSSLLDGQVEDLPTATSPAVTSESLAGQFLGPYRLLEVLGRGGLGTVYAAERADGQFERKLAVKVVSRHLISARLLADLRRERQILARFEHPNIARLYDGGEDSQGRPFLAMELVDGEPIDQFCKLHDLPLKQRLRLFMKVCDAVAHAHRNLVIHRDLKPSNVLVTADGVPKLLDFGIALPVSEEGSGGRGPQAFTPDYASPEQIGGRALTTATDVYSLGVMLYRLLCRQAPYDLGKGLSPPEIETRLQQGPSYPPSVAAQRSGHQDWRALSMDLDAIAARAMAVSPEDRYASVEQLAEDLQRHLAMVPVTAVDGTWPYRANKFLRRHRLPVTVAALAFVAMASALAATSWALLQTRRARANAEAHLVELRSEQHRSSAMIESFVGTFSLADPGEARGETISVRQLIDRSVAALPPAEGSTDPELSARLVGTFGQIYLNLGSPEQAAELFNRALQRSPTGPESADQFHWRTRALLAEAQIDQGQTGPATEALQLAIREYRQHVSQRGVGLARLIHTLGVAHLERAEFAAAAALFRQAIWLFEDDPASSELAVETTESRHRLAQAMYRSGALEEAEDLIQQVLEFRRAGLGEDHPTTVIALADLSAMALHRGQNERAADLFEQVLAKHRTVFGNEHPHVATALQNLATAQRRLGLNDLARANLLEVVELRRRLHRESHPAVANALYGLARSEHQDLRFDEAAKIYRQAFELRRRHLGEDHPETAMALFGLADVAWSRERLDEAESLYRQVLRRLDAADKGDTLDASYPSYQLGILLLRLDQTEAGCGWLEKAYTIRLSWLGPEHRRSRESRDSLAPCQRFSPQKEDTNDHPPTGQS